MFVNHFYWTASLESAPDLVALAPQLRFLPDPEANLSHKSVVGFLGTAEKPVQKPGAYWGNLSVPRCNPRLAKQTFLLGLIRAGFFLVILGLGEIAQDPQLVKK